MYGGLETMMSKVSRGWFWLASSRLKWMLALWALAFSRASSIASKLMSVAVIRALRISLAKVMAMIPGACTDVAYFGI